MRKSINFVVSHFLMMLLSSCVSSTEPLSCSEKNHIHRVIVDPQISVPSSIQYAGPNIIAATIIVGMVGQGIAYASEASTREAIIQSMNQRGIKINQLFYQSFINELNSQTHFKVVYAEPYDAKFHLEILSYGFSDSLQDKHTLPFVNVEARLTNLQGQVIWQVTKEVDLNGDDYDGHTVHDYLQDKALMQNMYNALFSQTSNDLVSKLVY